MMARLLLLGLACGLVARSSALSSRYVVRMMSSSASSPIRSPYKLPRIYVATSAVSIDRELVLDSKTSHYLSTVMRVRDGELVRIFNNVVLKEFLCEVISVNKSSRNIVVVIKPLEVLKDGSNKTNSNSIISYIAPIKRAKMKLLLEKITECGVDRIVQVVTQNTQANNIVKTMDNNNNNDDDNDNNITRMIIESCEQCERLDIPILDFSPLKVSALLERFANENNGNILFVCRERQNGGIPFLAALSDHLLEGEGKGAGSLKCKDVHMLIGPEGGFTDDEYALIDSKYSHVVKYVSLNNENVLRAETAAVAAVAIAKQFLDYSKSMY